MTRYTFKQTFAHYQHQWVHARHSLKSSIMMNKIKHARNSNMEVVKEMKIVSIPKSNFYFNLKFLKILKKNFFKK